MRFLLFLFLLSSCHASEKEPVTNYGKYLFLGHTYRFHDWRKVDKRLEKIDYNKFDGIWLGGDITSEVTREKSVLNYLDSLFDLSNPRNHWTVGNHDIRSGNVEWISEKTKRPLYYATHHEGMTVVVLNTNLDAKLQKTPPCEEIAAQNQFLQSVLDTISKSSHLMILTHHMIWGLVPEFRNCYAQANSCRPKFQFSCDEYIRFYPHVYEKLKEIRAKNIQVLVASGDAGMFKKKIHHRTPDDIHFFMAGMCESLDLCKAGGFYHKTTYNANPDSALIFHHYPLKKTVEWEFVAIKDLVEK